MTRRWLTIPEAAAELGMSRQTIWRRVRQRRVSLPTVDGRLVVPNSRMPELAADPTIRARRYRSGA